MKLKKGGRISFTNNLMKIMKKNKVLKNSHEFREKKKMVFSNNQGINNWRSHGNIYLLV